MAKKKVKKKAVKKLVKKAKIVKKAKKAAPKKTAKKAAAKKVAKKVTAKTTAKKSAVTQKLMSPEPKVKVGAIVPNFTIHATGGKTISLEDLKGKNVVLYFYPKDMTPGCTLEGHDFTKLHPDFQKNNTEVFGISKDPIASHEKFKSKEGYCFDLLSDESGELTELFGVWKQKQLYGKTYMGIERSTFLIDKDGKLAREWRAVRVDGHAQEVLGAVKS